MRIKGEMKLINMTCPNCGAAMSPDSYGYKATCGHCGYEIILNTDNSPQRINVYSKCTSCGATFSQFKNSTNFAFCTYCGSKVLINNENEHIYRHIDEAEIKKAETEQMVQMKNGNVDRKAVVNA